MQIVWLSGPAGSGKTAIAGAIADECQARGWLAASFFFSAFSESPQRRVKQFLVATLVYHLIHHETIPHFKEHVLSSVANNPSVFQKRLGRQLEILILEPLRKLRSIENRDAWPKLIVIDGLDECDADREMILKGDRERQRARESIHQEILPERVIVDFFRGTPDLATEFFFDDKYNPDADIALFLGAKFAESRRRFNLGEDWLSKDVIATLVKRQLATDPPNERLSRIVEWRRFDSSKPFAPLDSLYKRILQTSPDPLLAAIWLCATNILERVGLIGRTASGLRRFDIKSFLESAPGEAEHLLVNLASLVALKSTDGRHTYHLYHKSVAGFLNDSGRSGDLYVGDTARRFLHYRLYESLKERGPQGQLDVSLTVDEFIVAHDFLEAIYFDWTQVYEHGDACAQFFSSSKYISGARGTVPAVLVVGCGGERFSDNLRPLRCLGRWFPSYYTPLRDGVPIGVFRTPTMPPLLGNEILNWIRGSAREMGRRENLKASRYLLGMCLLCANSALYPSR
ncbi:hypothetical protein NMY22_g5793 [Coprinellus aureogranulatus]|nr:hypothetical protein NMY22_g5793 [Coprinellus aureogranulatus]